MLGLVSFIKGILTPEDRRPQGMRYGYIGQQTARRKAQLGRPACYFLLFLNNYLPPCTLARAAQVAKALRTTLHFAVCTELAMQWGRRQPQTDVFLIILCLLY